MTESTNYPTIHPDQLACRGCVNFHEIDGVMECVDLNSFDGPVPKPAPCFAFHQSFLDALKSHNAIVRQYGEDSPEQRRAMMILMEVSPPHIIDEIHDIACDMGIMPAPSGYSDDGTPLFSMEAIANHLGITPEEAELAAREMLADRESIGLSNSGVVTGPGHINTIN